MLDWFLLVYMTGAIIFAFHTDIFKSKGKWMRVGFVVYLPFILLVLLFNRKAFD